MSVAEKLTAIADAIRNHLPISNPLTLDDMAEKVPDVYSAGIVDGYEDGESDGWSLGYDAGYDYGFDEGYTEGETFGTETGIEQGKQDAYDYFWDTFQQNGTRTDYCYAFGPQWTQDIWKPKYPIRPTIAYSFSYRSTQSTSPYFQIADFVNYCTENEIVLDFSNCKNVGYAFTNIHSPHFGVIDLSSVINSDATSMFYSHDKDMVYGVKKIDKIVFSSTTVIPSNTFREATKLSELTVEGVINTRVNFQYNPLTVDSMKSIINCLKDGAGKTVYFSDSCWEALEADSTAPDGGTWKEYVKTKGWNY